MAHIKSSAFGTDPKKVDDIVAIVLKCGLGRSVTWME